MGCDSLECRCPTTTIPSPTPVFSTVSNIVTPTAYCWPTNNNGTFLSFDESDGTAVIIAFCSNGYVLNPGDFYGHLEEQTAANGAMIYAQAKWAVDQTDCATEADFPLDSSYTADCEIALSNCATGCEFCFQPSLKALKNGRMLITSYFRRRWQLDGGLWWSLCPKFNRRVC